MKHMVDLFAPPPSLLDAPADAASERGYYSITEAATLFGVSRVSIWRWISAGRLPAVRIGQRTTRIKREDLQRLLAEIGPAGSRSWVGRSVRAGVPAKAASESTLAPLRDSRVASASEHFVQFYETDAFLLDAASDFIGEALRAGDAGIVVATEAHRAGLDERLQESGLDVMAARACGRYVSLDANETLASFMANGAPEPERFARAIGAIIVQAAAGGRQVRVFGEMVALLAGDGNHEATVRLEALWNELQKAHSFALFCAYPMEGLGGEALAKLLRDVCAEHTAVLPAESYTALPTADERLRAIAVLQQKARSLEMALASEKASREAAEQALRLRDEFLSIASHELKTPLTSLMGYAQSVLRRLQRDGQLDPARVVQTLELVSGQAQKLSRLVNQLFDISRLEAGKLVLERQPVDLVSLVQQAVSDARALSDRHTIAVQAPATLHAQVDPVRLEQVLVNLLENAIKYSPGGGPIEVVIHRPEAAAAELSVRDCGLGIPADRREQIFERFYQAHQLDHRSGLGLGLYISSQIVELHGGTIRAEFPADGGTCFIVRLPIDPNLPAL